ncbi:Type I phosphodiesterase / nucleotide pyrophosphatase [Desulfotomaculum arcticum]|uniref:Type I phosphodiesterase / nucleotide pyrophosphatase n=1 Tax=Desulfotruncus arcticus DSM 17038 TaxID=1121424 RepID=A0A1I2VZB5_9FIRM|nr:alkaline phosphatase family protein [Desulfotruncus arcticus]SFG93126.1 Type I phosphodiesterase / nucleotide pyrophosphatase [Desulfotomaculum arcticum] [Desulfotruncus arcticus DSM 17038]
MENKVILVLIDGLNYEVGVSRMGFLHHLVENEIAQLYKVQTELPTLSRPLYEVILTGTPPYENGIVNNQITRKSKETGLFELARNNALTTAAAAYSWISELYNRSPFNLIEDRDQKNKGMNIQYGKFYFDDAYPDSHLFIDGEVLRRNFDPHFLLIHPMGADYTGHLYGANSQEYYNITLKIDSILSTLLTLWIKEDYQIIITSDHGMSADKNHGGIAESERMVPLWTIGSSFKKSKTEPELVIPQRGIAPTICRLLNIEKAKKMLDYHIPGLR